MTERTERKQQILQAVARMLQYGQGKKITTAELAREVGVSEAALYRHFPSKAKMYEALIDFTEEALFSRISLISKENIPVQDKCNRIITVVLTFAERNPGICRLLSGDALTGETPRLLKRIQQLFERCETQLRQIIREAEYREHTATSVSGNIAANLLVALVEGRIRQFIRSDFQVLPTQGLAEQLQVIENSLFSPGPDPAPSAP